jgi:hypothetical protein
MVLLWQIAQAVDFLPFYVKHFLASLHSAGVEPASR